MKHKILAVTGMTGVGKDFLVERANQSGIEAVNLGTIIGTILHTNRDEMMTSTDPASIRAAQFAAYREVISRQPLIVTCHAVREHGSGYAYDLEMEQLFNPHTYVFITAPAELIAERVKRRNLQGERKSPVLFADEIAEIQQTKLVAMEALTQSLGCELVVINNTPEQLAENIQTLQNLIDSALLQQ